jgi:hypothetical protein
MNRTTAWVELQHIQMKEHWGTNIQYAIRSVHAFSSARFGARGAVDIYIRFTCT